MTERLNKNSRDECCAVQKVMKQLVQSQIRWLGRKMRACNFGAGVDPTHAGTSRKTAWGKFSTMAFHNIVESIQLVTSLFPRESIQHFPQELIELKYNSKLMFSFYVTENEKLAKPAAPKKRGAKKDDELEKLAHPGWYQPLECYGGEFENPRHWGFLTLKFLEFLQREGDIVLDMEKAEEASKMAETKAAVLERAVSPRGAAASSAGPAAKRPKLG